MRTLTPVKTIAPNPRIWTAHRVYRGSGDVLMRTCHQKDVISLVVARAEREAGYTPAQIGWLPWFGRILRGQSELLQTIRQSAEFWPPLEREIFEFYYVDRLALADIALLVGCTAKVFHTRLLFIQRRLRKELIREVLSESTTLVVDNWMLRLKRRKRGNGDRPTVIWAWPPLRNLGLPNPNSK